MIPLVWSPRQWAYASIMVSKTSWPSHSLWSLNERTHMSHVKPLPHQKKKILAIHVMCPGLIRRNGSSTGNVTAARILLQCRPWFDLLGFHSLDLCNFWVSIMKPHGSLGLGERCGGQLRSDEGGLHLCLWDVPCSLVPGCSPSWWLWSFLAGRLEFNCVPPISWLVATCMISIFVKNSNYSK